ncbi:MAG: amidohydrolase family protein, partial [Clostridiales bacterium]|nr:amidohydrolase family protein [Clostridiales bacterium]
IDCAAGRKESDLVIRNIQIFNVFTGEIETGEIAVTAGKIVGIGKGYRGRKEYDGAGATAIPGLIDSHIHVESSLLSPEEFAHLAAVHGTTGIVADPHELVNVCGIEGAEYVKEAFSRLTVGEVNPIDVYLQLPSCVPATPFETSGAKLSGEETAREIGRDTFFGLGEMMNYPAVVAGEEDVLRKIEAAHEAKKIVDGHAPMLSGMALNAYAAAGISTDHESETVEECREKISRGMYIQLRGGSSASNLERCAGAVDAFNFRRFLICSDDKNARDLRQKGHIDDALRRLVKSGLDPAQAVCMATKNVADCYKISGKGALAPSYDADIVLVKDLKEFEVTAVFKSGALIAQNGKALFDTKNKYLPAAVRDTVHIRPVSADDFALNIGSGHARAMFVRPHTILTDEVTVPVEQENGDVRLAGTDLCKLAVIERHFASGNLGLGLVKDFGLTGGALGISVAHD